MTHSKQSREDIDKHFVDAQKLENEFWKQVNEQNWPLEVVTILVSSLAGRMLATISQMKSTTRIELHALYANVFWKVHQEVAQTIPEIVFGERLQKILDDVLNSHTDSTH